MDYTQLKPGYRFTPTRIHFGRDEVDAYRQAVGDTSPLYDQQDVVPAMAVAAFALRELLAQLKLHPGTAHAGQELTFHRAVQVEQSLTFDGTVAQNFTRGGWSFLAVDLRVGNDEETMALEGRSMVIFPLEEA